MSEFFEQVRTLISSGDVRISEHGYDELSEDGLTVRGLIAGVSFGGVSNEEAKENQVCA